MPKKPKLGRPPISPEDRRSVTLTIRVTPAQAQLLNAWADDARIPLSELAAEVLSRAAARRRPWV